MENGGTPLYKKILTAVLCLLAVVYVIYHIALNFRKDAELFAVSRMTVTDSETFTGYLFRDSITLTSYAGGVCYYPYEDGEKIASGKVAAYVYRSASTALTEQIENLQKQINVLHAGSRVGGTNLQALQKEIDRLSYQISEKTAKGNTAAAELLGEELLVLMAKKELILSGKTDYTAEIASLEWQMQALISSLGSPAESVITSESGYFYRDADGLESIFTAEAAQNLTLESFDRLLQTTAGTAGNAVGALLLDFRWYYAAKTDAASAEGFAVGETYACTFPENAYTEKLSMTVLKKMTDGENALIVFACDNLPKGFDNTRCQRMEVIRKEYTGYRVPAEEVRVVDGNTCVYIFKEGCAKLREIDIIWEQNGYYLAACDYVSASGNATLRENDLIIVGEDGLYDGKIIK